MEIARAEVDSSDLALSPDGAKIYLRGWDSTTAWTEVVDASSLKPFARLPGSYLVTGWRLDGQPVLVSSVNNEYQTALSALDPITFSEVTKWRVPGYANWLILP